MQSKPILKSLVMAVGLAGAGHAAAEEVAYMIEPTHTYPAFRVPHMGISWFTGKFDSSSGAVTLDRAAGTGTVKIAIDPESIDSGNEKLNQHLQNEDFFNVAKYPEITYQGDIRFEGDTPASVEGELTMIGNTQPVTLTVNSFKCIQHPMFKREVCGADLEGEFNRRDFGMNYGASNEADGVVKLLIQVEALKQ